MEKKEIAIRYLQTNLMPVDIIKALPRCGHLHGVRMMRMLNLNEEDI